MSASSESAAEFNQALCALASRLAAHDIVVSRLRADWGAFGSWELWMKAGPAADAYSKTIMRGLLHPTPAPKVLSCTWDGRDRYLGVKWASPKRLEGPTDWQHEQSRKLRNQAEAIEYVEAYAVEQLAGA